MLTFLYNTVDTIRMLSAVVDTTTISTATWATANVPVRVWSVAVGSLARTHSRSHGW